MISSNITVLHCFPIQHNWPIEPGSSHWAAGFERSYHSTAYNISAYHLSFYKDILFSCDHKHSIRVEALGVGWGDSGRWSRANLYRGLTTRTGHMNRRRKCLLLNFQIGERYKKWISRIGLKVKARCACAVLHIFGWSLQANVKLLRNNVDQDLLALPKMRPKHLNHPVTVLLIGAEM